MKITTENLIFEIEKNAQNAKIYSEKLPLLNSPDWDFWRMMLDDDEFKELPVHSSAQRGNAFYTDDGMDIEYSGIVAENEQTYNISVIIHIKVVNNRFSIYADIENDSQVRVNEMQLPHFRFESLCDENKENDVLYYPNGLGEKIEKPWTSLRKYHTEYISSDYKQIMYSMTYPSPLGMCWMGVETGGYFFYIGKHDNKLRTQTLEVGNTPRNTKDGLILSVSSYPLANNGEKYSTSVFEFGLLKGDWRKGSDAYGEYARANWYAENKKPGWVKEITGWQRIILKHQYGEIFFKYDDLPRIYSEGAKYGLNMLLVFGWWKGRFDNGYPLYEPDEALGGEEKLKEAIEEIHRMGGRVALYSNGVLIDTKSDFYKECGHLICRKDIDGNEYREHYRFSNEGSVLRQFGYKSFVSACHATEEWHNMLIHNGKNKLSFNPDSIFYDQIGGHPPLLCFDNTHLHGNRGDSELEWLVENFKDIKALCGEGQAFGTEFTIDIYAPYTDYHHGCSFGNWPEENIFPEMFLRTFPEPVQTDRYLHDNREGFREHLNYAFIYGYRFDVSVFRGRKCILSDIPELACHIKKLIDKKNEYHDYFYGGKVVVENIRSMPDGVRYCEHRYKDSILVALLNSTDDLKFVCIDNNQVEVKPHDVECLVIYDK